MSTNPPRPHCAVPLLPDAVPDDLKERDQFVCWRNESREKKRTKVPRQTNGQTASSTDPTTWGPFDEACEAYQRNPDLFDGVGFVFTADDPFVGIDLDNCLDENDAVKPWAREIVEQFWDTYMEISPSGKGLKIFAKGELPGKGKAQYVEDGRIEIYDQGRFFTLTGNVFNHAPSQIEEHQFEIDVLYKRISGSSNNGNHQSAHDTGNKIPKGHRHNTLVSLAGSMRRRGMGVDAIEAALWIENCTRCEPPKSREEVRKIAESAGQWAPASEASATDDVTAPATRWPDPLKQEAFHGISGELVRLIEPHSEADLAALLIQFLVCVGNLVGRIPHFIAEADRHFLNLFAVIVGQTSKGRKGTSLGQIRKNLACVDSAWSRDRVMGGLSSGEGLICAVRDEVRELKPSGKKGSQPEYKEVITDAGVNDKRLLVVEPEFARVLQVAERESNTLSAIMRQAWDDGTLRILTKKQAAATGAHISIVGHITKSELQRLLTDTAVANGFANRFLWVCARRSKLLPEGGALNEVDFNSLQQKIQDAVLFARNVGVLRRDDDAKAVWRDVYPALSEGKPGMFGSVTSRAEAQTMRLACLYALLDRSPIVCAQHLMAALAVWQYAEASARFIFGDALGDPTADEILRALRSRAEGMTRTEIREIFQRNKTSAETSRALGVLLEYGLASMTRLHESDDQKRPPERWKAITL
jgi:Protein of unknown function (DUF3987)/Primase C terminal 1 (PriCT-1)